MLCACPDAINAQPGYRPHDVEHSVRKSFYLKTFGCQMNVYDSERMTEALAREGYAETAELEAADLVILNTCHIREKAAEKVYSDLGRIRDIKDARGRHGKNTVIAVAGCVAQAEGAEITARQPAVDLVIGPQSYHRLPELIKRARTNVKASSKRNFRGTRNSPALTARRRVSSPSAFLTVQEGCDKFCTLLRRALYARRRILAARRQDRSRGSRTRQSRAPERSFCSGRTSTPITAKAPAAERRASRT